MNRRTFLRTTAVTGAGLTSTMPGRGTAGPAAAPNNRPNVLWICTDQQRWDTIGALGNPYVHTPNIDRLVHTGVAFTHAHCQAPICTPSRAAFLTGMYPDTVHACINGNEYWDNAAPLITKTLADVGYDCGLAGKLHLSAAEHRIEPRPDDGYRVFHWSHHPADDWPKGHAYADWLKSRGQDYTRLHDRYGYIPAEYHQTTWCTDMAVDFMKEQRQGPWLFSLNCFDPHPPSIHRRNTWTGTISTRCRARLFDRRISPRSGDCRTSISRPKCRTRRNSTRNGTRRCTGPRST